MRRNDKVSEPSPFDKDTPTPAYNGNVLGVFMLGARGCLGIAGQSYGYMVTVILNVEHTSHMFLFRILHNCQSCPSCSAFRVYELRALG